LPTGAVMNQRGKWMAYGLHIWQGHDGNL